MGYPKQLMTKFIKAGIPEKYLEIETDRNIDRYMEDKGLYVWGKAGVGKTVLACSIAKEFIKAGWPVEYISSPKFIMQLQDLYRNTNESAYSKLEYVSNIPLLIVDDIGAEKLTDFVKQSFYFIINEREQWERNTIITSNYSLDDLDMYIDSRISSRIAGACEVVELTGKDRRL